MIEKNYRKMFDDVVRGVLNGTLEHKQKQWHCGTAHCVAGWFEIFTMDHMVEEYRVAQSAFRDKESGRYHRFNRLFREVAKSQEQSTSSMASIIHQLTGYPKNILIDMFLPCNDLYDIARYAEELHIDTTYRAPVRKQVAETQSVSVRG